MKARKLLLEEFIIANEGQEITLNQLWNAAWKGGRDHERAKQDAYVDSILTDWDWVDPTCDLSKEFSYKGTSV